MQGIFLQSCAADNMPVDVVLMDPPRAGSSEEFLDAVAKIGPKRVVYVSCNPTTLERDCTYLEKQGYRAKEVWPVDMFPWSGAVEAVCLLEKTQKRGYMNDDRRTCKSGSTMESNGDLQLRAGGNAGICRSDSGGG